MNKNNTETKYVLATNDYGNVTEIPEGWVRVPSDIRTNPMRIDSIPSYKLLVGFEKSGSFYSPILDTIVPRGYVRTLRRLDKERAEKEAKKTERAKIRANNLADVLASIYSVNKEAKRLRDVQENIGDSIYCEDAYRGGSLAHYQLHAVRERKEGLYELKDAALNKVIATLGVAPRGYHTFGDGEKRDYYEIDGYGYHRNECTSDTNLGHIDGQIDSTRKRSPAPSTAVKILRAYIA